MTADFYELLGIPFNATQEEIRSAYFQLVRRLHPDVNPDPDMRETFLQIQEAYETLSNPPRRSTYDDSLPAELKFTPAISVSTRYSQSVLSTLDEPQLVYALIDLVCTADLSKEHLPASHFCMVLDKSTSMQGQRMDMVKSSSLNLLQQLRSQDILSVIAFSDRAEVLIPPTRASALSKSDHRISLLQTGGGTEILQGLMLGVNQLRQTSNQHIRQLILLTDGHTYGDEEGCIELAKEAAEEGISISVLGIGDEWNDVLMDRIAALSGGNTMYIATPHDLENFLLVKLSEMEGVYGRGLKFVYQSDLDVRLRYAFRLSPNIGHLETENPIQLGDIQHRKTISFLLEFVVPPLYEEKDRLTLASGKIMVNIPGQKVFKSRLLLDLRCPVRRHVEPESPPAVIVEAMSKLTLYRLQEKVRKEVSEGQVEKATRHMHYLATHLLSQGDRELAHTVLMEAEHVQQSRRFSGEGEKRIKYGTRALMLPQGPELRP